jgi:hypothetical protein
MMRKQRTNLPSYRILLILSMMLLLWLVQLAGVVAAPARQGQDLAIINSPASNAVIRTVQIVGSSDHPSFQFYSVNFRRAVTGDQ